MSKKENITNWRSVTLDLEHSPRKVRNSRSKNKQDLQEAIRLNETKHKRGNTLVDKQVDQHFNHKPSKVTEFNQNDTIPCFDNMLKEMYETYKFETENMGYIPIITNGPIISTSKIGSSQRLKCMNQRKVKRQERVMIRIIQAKKDKLEAINCEQGSSSTPQTRRTKKTICQPEVDDPIITVDLLSTPVRTGKTHDLSTKPRHREAETNIKIHTLKVQKIKPKRMWTLENSCPNQYLPA
jgi:hypothetical protein